MIIYNTYDRKKEELKPIDGNRVRIYSCGPTVYNYAHIGNMRTYIFMDELRRVLKWNGYTLLHVMNITDVGHLTDDGDDGEDKMLKGAREQKKTPWEIAEYYTKIFFNDLKSLNIEKPEIVPKATDNIPEMIEFVQGLMENGYAYEISDGIYFDVEKFKGYGKLSGLSLKDQQAGARVESNPEKHHPADFALWKKAPKEHIMQWPSPWGMGYPGWHIECSTMSTKYLGETFDIHTGGVDHIPVHHENEIAQSEGKLGHKSVNYWMHGEFMLVDGGKMSKSLGNTYTLADLQEKGYSPLVFRYFCLNAHYRNKLNFTWDGMRSAKVAYEHLLQLVESQKNGTDKVDQEELSRLKKEFEDAINDDLNIPKALGLVWSMLRLPVKSRDIYDAVIDCDRILGLDLDKGIQVEKNENLNADIEEMIQKRQEARKNRDFALADKIRDELKEQGIILEDTKEGVQWHRA